MVDKGDFPVLAIPCHHGHGMPVPQYLREVCPGMNWHTVAFPTATPLNSLKAPRVDTAPVVSSPYQRRDSDRYCGLCAAWFNNPLMAQQHYDGKKHKKNAARVALLEQLGTSLDLGELRGKGRPSLNRLPQQGSLQKPCVFWKQSDDASGFNAKGKRGTLKGMALKANEQLLASAWLPRPPLFLSTHFQNFQIEDAEVRTLVFPFCLPLSSFSGECFCGWVVEEKLKDSHAGLCKLVCATFSQRKQQCAPWPTAATACLLGCLSRMLESISYEFPLRL